VFVPSGMQWALLLAHYHNLSLHLHTLLLAGLTVKKLTYVTLHTCPSGIQQVQSTSTLL
jgi:hypothetical protein